jgi:hypothetical protein
MFHFSLQLVQVNSHKAYPIVCTVHLHDKLVAGRDHILSPIPLDSVTLTPRDMSAKSPADPASKHLGIRKRGQCR